MPIVHFLLVYDRRQQKLIFQQRYADSQEAVAAYEQMEEKHRGEREMEIVLVGADSVSRWRLRQDKRSADTGVSMPLFEG